MLGREIAIEKVDGIFVNQITLHGVKIARHKKIKDGIMASAEKMVVQYNPFKILVNKGDVIPAISHLSVYGLNVSVERSKNGHLNVEELSPKSEVGKKAAPFPFYGQIHIKSGSANYTDLLGFGPNPLISPFTTPVENIKAEIDLRFPGKMLLRARGQAKAAEIYTKGDLNLNTGRYDFDFDVKNIDFSQWGDYILPIPNFKASSGSADLKITLKSPSPKSTEAFLAQGKAQIKDSSIILLDNHMEKINGVVAISQKEIGFSNLQFSFQDLPNKLNGKIYDFSHLTLDLSLQGEALEIKDLQKQINLDLGLKGKASYTINIKGVAVNPKIFGQANFSQSSWYQYPLSGKVVFDYQNAQLKIIPSPLKAFNGALKGEIFLNLNEPIPAFDSRLEIIGLDLKSLSQATPGITGSLNGQVQTKGNIIKNQSSFSGTFVSASILGQSLKKIKGKLTYEKGDINIENLEFTSHKGYLNLSGLADHQQNVSILASTEGLHLKGETVLGKTSATITRYFGPVKFKLNNDFFSHPLKNITAGGNLLVEDIQLGPQKIEKLEGPIALEKGIIIFSKVKAYQEYTALVLDGKIGPGIDSNVSISSEALDIKDLKILSLLLPPDSADLYGQGQLSILINGPLLESDDLALPTSWKKLKAQIQLNLKNCQILQTRLDQVDFSGILSPELIKISQLNLKSNDNNFSLNGEINPASANLSWQGKISLKDLKYFTQKYGRFEGLAQIKGTLKDTLNHPSIALEIEAQNFRYNSIILDKIEGEFIIKNYKLVTHNKLKIKNQKDAYDLSFSLDLDPKLDFPSLNLEAEAKEAQAESLAQLTWKILLEIEKFTAPPSNFKMAQIKEIKTPDKQKYIEKGFLRLDPGYLKDFSMFIQDIEKKNEAERLPFDLKGKVKGKIQLSGPINNLSGSINGKLEEGKFNDYKFDSLTFITNMAHNQLDLNSLELTEQGGKINLSGIYSFVNGFKAQLKAQNMPLNILRLIFKNKFFDGRVNLNANLTGFWQKPYFRAVGSAKNIAITNQKFDLVDLDLEYQPERITFHQLKILKDKKESFISGKIPLSSQEEYQLNINLQDQALALVNLFQDAIAWEGGRSQTNIILSGPAENIDITGCIKLNEGKMRVLGLDINLEKINANLSLNNGQVKIDHLVGFWQGENTNDLANPIRLSGTLNLQKVFSPQKKVDLNLTMQDADFQVDFPRLFSGSLRLSNLELNGPFYFLPEAKDGPTLRGQIDIYEGKIILPEGKNPSQDLFLKYDLTMNIQKNTYIKGGDLGRFDFYLNLMAQSQNFQIKGNYKYPSFYGKIFFERGMINIFNRDLVLIDKRQQSLYYPYNLEILNDNVAIFKGYSGPEGVLPELTLAAEIKVFDYIKPLNTTEKISVDKTKFEKKEIFIVAHIKGTPAAKEKEHGLDMKFDAFEKKSSTEMLLTNYSDQKIKVLLLPEFLKSSFGLSEGGPQDIRAEEVLVDYLDNRLQNVVLRDLERRLEKQLNVESLSLEYNFGRQIRKNLASNRPLENPSFEETLFGIGFVKSFFDRLYIDVKYKQLTSADEKVSRSIYNYELRYKLGGIWSISYWREPYSFADLLSGVSKATLQAVILF